ncbi:type IV-A pilus assembly ATPase PilB [Tepidiphilus baoligensis]|uniref:Type IV-A pilus assembly ATPase PilB n=1 Tax=Tepidiphilus baoligensis TaxID=2698687 RepID=A0ABX1QKR6_9PROT|nr:type IV-A pilus assembly ATPase PilB [Tepidiphilus baoligensis]NMH15986.1 type IV-A pilus assembly ATPase PilB [Tepidiphilus baoligensis]
MTEKTGLVRALIQKGWIDEKTVEQAQAKADDGPNALLLALIKSDALDERKVAQFAAETFGLPVLDIEAVNPDVLPRKLIDPQIASRYQIVALSQRKGKTVIAVADPTQVRVYDEIRFQTGMSIELVVAPAQSLARFCEKFYESTTNALSTLIQTDELYEEVSLSTESTAAEESEVDVEDAPVVRFIQKILIDAINEGASDIHFEPYEKFFRVRVRQDGVLREIARPPLALKEKISARLKIISRLDISEKRIPQDGRTKLTLSKNKSIDFRVSTLPTLWGEKIVLRILDASQAMLGIDALGYEPEQKAALLEAIERPYGMILVTGPTGSGKTVSLYTCLNLLNKPEVNISTAEDPVEINLPGINQVNINDKVGLTFASALRAFLRQDPDIIMVGEIRDLETADIGVKAAQTGHLLLSTLHTNDAPSTVERLRNIGIAPFNIASSVILITAQRLVRRLCTCKQPIDVPLEALISAGFTEDELDGDWQPYGPVGCEKCRGSGYKGRTGIYEVMPISDSIQRLVMANASAMEIEAQARSEGVRSLRQSGLLKVKHGITSLTEVLAATND